MILGTSLPEDNITSENGFSAEFFDAQAFTVAVSSVLGSSLSFFMCYEKWVEIISNQWIQFRQLIGADDGRGGVCSPDDVFEHDNLLVLFVFKNFGCHYSTLDSR